MSDLAKRVRSSREESGMSMRDLAEAAGVSLGTVHAIEHGKYSPRVVTLERVAVGLGVPVVQLLVGK